CQEATYALRQVLLPLPGRRSGTPSLCPVRSSRATLSSKSNRSATQLQSLDQAGVDQQPIEAARFGTMVAAVEQAVAALEHFLLLDEARIERHPGGLLHDQRKVGRLDPLARRRQVQRPEVDR